MELLQSFTEFNTVSVLVRLFLAALFGALIGIERGRHGRAAGLRTHILVCLGAALTSLIGLFSAKVLGNDGDVLRISAQVVSGIGFLGVGMILVRNRTIVTGLTTAAGLWTTAIIGLAVGFGFYLAAIVTTLLCVLVTAFLGLIEKKSKMVTHLYVEISAVEETGSVVRSVREIFPCNAAVDIVEPKSRISGHLGLVVALNCHSVDEEKVRQVESLETVVFAVEEEGAGQ